MRLRSTGLGKTELEAEIIDIKKVDDLVVFFVNTTKPVKWHIRMSLEEQDLRDLMHAILKPMNLWFVIRSLLHPQKKAPRTKDF